MAGQELLNGDDKWVGPFIANPPETKANTISIDIVMPKGLYYANDRGGLDQRTITWATQSRIIDSQGIALSNWTEVGTETFTAATNTPQRLTYNYKVKPARYEIRAIRTNAKDSSGRCANELTMGRTKSRIRK